MHNFKVVIPLIIVLKAENNIPAGAELMKGIEGQESSARRCFIETCT